MGRQLSPRWQHWYWYSWRGSGDWLWHFSLDEALAKHSTEMSHVCLKSPSHIPSTRIIHSAMNSPWRTKSTLLVLQCQLHPAHNKWAEYRTERRKTNPEASFSTCNTERKCSTEGCNSHSEVAQPEELVQDSWTTRMPTRWQQHSGHHQRYWRWQYAGVYRRFIVSSSCKCKRQGVNSAISKNRIL